MHFWCHLAALALLALAILADNAWIAATGALVGFAGAIAFSTFFVILLLMAVLIHQFPALVTWLPAQMSR